MTIDFPSQSYAPFEHFKGGEGRLDAKMFFDGTNRILMGSLSPDSTIGYHTHTTSSEIILVLSGAIRMVTDEGEEQLTPGQVHYCPKGRSHAMYCAGPEAATFFAVVPEQ